MPHWLRYSWQGLLLRCPACGQGHIYRGFAAMNHECPTCRVVFEREEGDFLGAMVLAYSLTAVLVAAGILLVEWVTDLSVWWHVLVWSVATAAFLVLTYRNFKGLWVGILHAMVGLQRRQ